MRAFVAGRMGWVLVLALGALAQASCGQVEHDARAEEPALVSRETGELDERASCELGSLSSIAGCASAAGCHVCARVEMARGGVCVQACTIGSDECPSGQACRPIAELLDAGGYARIGDCPAGYCR